jgi:hypothetical protein
VSETNLAILNDETIVDAWLEHFKHLKVLHVVANVLDDITV